MPVLSRVREVLSQTGLSLQELSELADLSYVVVLRASRPRANPFLDDAFRIAKALGVPLNQLFVLQERGD